MRLFFNSLTTKTLFILFLSSSIFITITVVSANYFFSNGYMSIIKEDMTSIERDINPTVSLNMSYGFEKNIKEIADSQLKNNKVMLIAIESDNLKKSLVFSSTKKTLKELEKEGNFISKSTLFDPATSKKIGTMTLVYSNSSYKAFMDNFYRWFGIGTAVFVLSLILVGIFLYSNLRYLTTLAIAFEKFNPKEPKTLPLDINTNDEIATITKSANILFENLSRYIKNIQKLNETVLQKEAHLKQAQRIANIGSWEYDVVENELKLSDEIYRIFKLDLKTVVSWDEFLSYITQTDFSRVQKVIDRAVQNGSTFDITYTIKTDNGVMVDLRTRGKVRKKQDHSVKITAISMDITKENRNKKTIETLAYYDPLTTLPNRALLKDRIHKSLQSAKRDNTKLALLFLDLDHFKLINDTLGHDIGDKLLVHVANLLKSQLRASDTVSRIGGDEFVILIPKFDDIEDIKEIAQKCIVALRGKHTIGNHHLYITTSLGIALYPQSGKDLDSLMTSADTAMYDAKKDGRNNYKVFSKTMTNHISQQMQIEQDLRVAIEKQNQLEIYYQPKINTRSGFISGAEALIRWNHPQNGLMFPDEFINIAESTGLIIEMGNWIIEECISNISTWNKSGLVGLKIAINLSIKQFQDNNLTNYISLMIKKYNIDPSQLEFEITETLSMANIDATLRVLSCLRDIGVSIAIDDFGTGYSSLSYLKKFPINTLKIDKSFVMDMIDDEEDSIIVKTVISMAHSLGFQTVAEGVETQQHAKLLKEIECDQLQGYHYSRPIPKESFIQYLKNYIPDI